MAHRLSTRKRDKIKLWLNKNSGRSGQHVAGDLTIGTAAPLDHGLSEHVRTAQEHQKAGSRSLWDIAIKRLNPEEGSALGVSGSELDILTSLFSITQKKLELCERHQWEFTFFGKQFRIRSIVENIIIHLKIVREVVDTIVSWDPTHLALPWAAVKFLLQCAISENEQHSLLLLGLEKVACLTSRCFVYEMLYLQEDQQSIAAQSQRNLKTALLNLYVEILRFLSRANRAFSQHVIKRSVTAWLSAEGLKKQLQNLDTLEQAVYPETANHSVIKLSDGQLRLQQLFRRLEYPVSSIESQVSAIHKRLDREEREKILRWISELPYEAHHYSASKGKTVGTGTWLLQDDKYHQWQMSDISSVLWLHGSPGVGKTKLATTVVDDLSQSCNSEDKGLVYFYCDRNESSRRDPTTVLRSLVRQLSARAPTVSLPLCVVEEFERKQHKGFSSGTLSIEESKSLFRQLTKPLSSLSIIIDALDECEVESRIQLVNLLIEEADQPSKTVKIFFTSRDDRDIKQRLESSPNLKINASHNQGDIATYIRDRIRKASPSWWKGNVDEDLREHMCDTLIEKCDDMFQWAVLQINHLFKLSLRSEVLDRLGKLPKDLGKAYDEIHEFIKNQEGHAPVIAARAFQWVMCSYEAPSEELLIAAVCQDPSSNTSMPVNVDLDADYILHVCSNLLVHLKFEGVDEFRFSHLSVREHLETRLATTAQSHALVGKVCLTFLLDPVYQALNDKLPLDVDIRRWYNALFAAKIGGYVDKERSFKTKDANSWVIKAERKGGKVALKRISPLVNYARHKGIAHLTRAGRVSFDTDLDPRELLWEFFGSFEHTAPGFEAWYAFDRKSLKHDCLWSSEATLSKPWHYPSQSFPGKALFAICVTNLDDVTQELWQTWPLSDDVQDLAGNPLVRAIAFYRCVAMARHAFETGKLRDVEAIKSSFPLTLMTFHPRDRDEMQRLLLENGADNDTGEGIFRHALESVISTGDGNLLRRLLESGADVNAGAREYGYPLRTVAEQGSISGLKLLLEYGADVEAHSSTFPCPLQAAASNNQIDSVELLLEHGADINARSGKRGDALCAAASSHAIDIARLLISYGANVNAWDYDYCPAISAAAQNVDMVRLLLDNGADPNTSGSRHSPLQFAAHWKSLDSLKTLLAHGADVKATRNDFGSALHAAAASGCVESVVLLLDHGADVNAPSEEYGPVLHAGVSNVDVVRILLDSGADVNSCGGPHQSALQAAAQSKNIESVKVLLERGANVNGSGDYCGHALVAAADDVYIMKTLLEHDADVNAQGDHRHALYAAAKNKDIEVVRTPLDDHEVNIDATGGVYGSALQAALHGGSADIAQLLLEHGANADVFGGPHEYTLQAAILSKCLGVVEQLLKNGAKVDTLGSQYGCALQAAAKIDEYKTVELLLAHGANPNTRGGLYSTSLQAAASTSSDITSLLLSHGASIPLARGGKHGTALHAAVWSGDLDTVQVFLDHGADPNVTDHEGLTCLSRLKQPRWCQREIVLRRMERLLRGMGAREEIEQSAGCDENGIEGQTGVKRKTREVTVRMSTLKS